LDYFRGNLTNLIDTIKSLNYDYKYPMPRYYKEKQSILNLKKSRTTTSTLNKPENKESSSSASSSSSNAAQNESSKEGAADQKNPANSQQPAADNDSAMTSIYWMLQDPIDEVKFFVNKTVTDKITNRKVDQFNRESINLLYHSPINIWSSSRLVSQAYNRDSQDGLNIGPFALEIVIFDIKRIFELLRILNFMASAQGLANIVQLVL
jgi:hypothetical protein